VGIDSASAAARTSRLALAHALSDIPLPFSDLSRWTVSGLAGV
jgi:hypothetical protein